MDAPLALPYPTGGLAAAPAQPQRDSEGVMKAINTYRRHAPLFFAVLASVVLLALAYSLLQTPRYTATASVMIAPRKAEVGAESTAPSDGVTDANVDSQVEVLKSGLLAGAVVDALHLTGDRAFLASLDPPGRLDFLVGGSKPPPASISRAAAVDKLEKRVAIRRVAQTLVLEIGFSSPNADLAARIANGYANAFVAQSMGFKLQDSRSSNGLLASQLDKLRGQVEAAETAVSQYKVQHNLLSVAGSTMAEQEIVSLDQEVAANRASAAEAAARLGTARQQMARGSHGDDLGESLNSPVIQELRKERSEASGKLADLEVRFGSRFPDVVSTQQQIADIDRQIDAEIKRLISNLDAQNRVAAQRVGSLEGSVGSARGQLTTANTASVKLNELQRTADSERTLYEGVLNRVKETQTQEATAEPDARVSNYAVTPPAPSSPKLAINLLIGVLLGTGAAIALVVLREETDTGLRTLEDVEHRLRVPYFGALPTLKSSVRRPGSRSATDSLAQHASSSFAESFRGLAAALVNSTGRPGPKIVVFTSALPKEGKTTAAVCLARITAMAGLKVVLVDCDLRRPSIAQTCRITPRTGLLEVLDGRSRLDDALITDEKTNLAILPLMAEVSADRSPVTSPEMDRLLAELKSRFDLVLIDTSPVLPVIESRLLSQKADAVVMMVRWRKTPEKAASMAIHLLRELNVRIAGVALTRVDLKAQARSGYGDPTFYYSRYKGYYVP